MRDQVEMKIQRNELEKKNRNQIGRDDRKEICVWIEGKDEKGRRKMKKIYVWVKENEIREREENGMEKMYVWIEEKGNNGRQKMEKICVWIERAEDKKEEKRKKEASKYIEKVETIGKFMKESKQEERKNKNEIEREKRKEKETGQANICQWTEKVKEKRKQKERSKEIETKHNKNRREEIIACTETDTARQEDKTKQEVQRWLEEIDIRKEKAERKIRNWKIRKGKKQEITREETAIYLEKIISNKSKEIDTGQAGTWLIAAINRKYEKREKEIGRIIENNNAKEDKNMIAFIQETAENRKQERAIFVRDKWIEKGRSNGVQTIVRVGEEKWIGWRRERKKMNEGRAGFW